MSVDSPVVPDSETREIYVDADYLRFAIARAQRHLQSPDDRGQLAADVNTLVRLLRQANGCRILLVRVH